ncbi:sodium channel subunit beta-3 isoform X2 [Girardinichthys multiradiatus]|uniref:sodium channel subunit beta-3 isoform X2 n=1 Tax=Girardinichthys multiradiatus TaxID=208333 RepID=UPI001FAD9A67|nr:sodium channel subunit beta-3 isoform X2 [Girardinichthys multiradiatus]
MVTLHRVHLQTLLLLLFVVHLSRPVCVDVASDTEAVLGKTMKLTCISCLKREEVKTNTTVNWYFRPKENENTKQHIYKYENGIRKGLNEHFTGRLEWKGSKDLQDVSISILNVSESDSGFYECHVNPSNDTAAIYSEIMMYVLLVFLTFWLLVEMVYCYRKISKSDEQAQDAETNYLAVPSEQKDNTVAPVPE